jgi:hypothetical protein
MLNIQFEQCIARGKLVGIRKHQRFGGGEVRESASRWNCSRVQNVDAEVAVFHSELCDLIAQ